MKYLKLKESVLQYSQNLYKDKLVAATSGNISIYEREENVMVITPSSVSYMKMTVDSIIVMELDGNILEGAGRPSSEWQMHAEIYKSRDDINSVVHTHSQFATAFAVLHRPLPVILIEMIPWLRGDIKVTQFAIPGTPEVGHVALKALAERNACLLANHGVIAVGEEIEDAYAAAAYVEDVASIYYKAISHGDPVMVTDEAIQMMYQKYFGKSYEY